MNKPQNPQPAEHINPARLLKLLRLSIKRTELYGSSHPIAKSSVNTLFDEIKKYFEKNERIVVSAADKRTMLVDDVPVEDDSDSAELISDFEHTGINTIFFNSTLTLEDVFSFLSIFHKSKAPGAEPLSESLEKSGVSGVKVGRARYELVMDGEVVVPGEEQQNRSPRIEAIFRGLDPKRVERVITELSSIPPETLQYLIENRALERISEAVRRFSFDGDVEGAQRALNEILPDKHHIPEVSSFVETVRSEFIRPIKINRDINILTKADKRADFARKIQDELDNIEKGSNTTTSRKAFHNIFTDFFATADNDEVDEIYEFILKAFESNPNPAFLIVAESFIKALFENIQESIVYSFTRKRVTEKIKESHFAHSTEFLTTVLVWITTLLLIRGKLLPALNIAKTFEAKLTAGEIEEKLQLDAETYFASLAVGEPLDAIVNLISEQHIELAPELLELIKLSSSPRIASRILDYMGSSGKDYPILVAKALSSFGVEAGRVFARYLTRIESIPRDSFHRILHNDDLKRIVGALQVLALLGGDDALPLLSIYADDEDPEVRFAALEAISRVSSLKATQILVRYLYAQGGKWREDVIRLLPRVDPAIAVPMLERYFHTRRDKWIDIIVVIGKMGGEQAKAFLLGTLDSWNNYVGGMNRFEVEEFVIALIHSIGQLRYEPELKRALDIFLSEWHNFDVLRGLKALFGHRKDLISDNVKDVVSKWRETE